MSTKLTRRVSDSFTALGAGASQVVQRYLPNAFIFALLLTFVTMVLAVALTPSGPVEVTAQWGEGFWYVITFSMQASLALLTGWALADSPPVKRVLGSLATVPSSQRQAILLTAIVGQLVGLFHWGMVLIVGGIFAREVGIAMDRKDIEIHYPLLVATAYAGLLPWHQGLSGASYLLSATPGHFLEGSIGVIPVSATMFTAANLVTVGAVVLLTLVLMPLMAPKEDLLTVPAETLRSADAEIATDGGRSADPHRERTSALKDALVDSRLLCVGTGLVMWSYLGYLFATSPFTEVLNINLFISAMLGLGFVFHTSFRSFFEVFREAIEGASQVIIQFQFYGGIMGIMAASGLAELIAATAANYATETTWYLLVFLSAGTVNFFVPSGGGQWTVTGELLVNATRNIPGTDIETMMIAFAMGDQWTNMIQPFWAIPVLGIAGLSIRDMMGYVAVLFVFSGVVFGIGTLLMGFGVL
ncbi:short chain fatty acid transporter [Halalkalicoccus paucihalophilus]|uniref:Short chain fatty acid transporter n=1 Tax=Halalkalicoccus paucihalophilus TaxID=1008153 RepID=A0A151ABT8_9EURY|nr:TIGR00366 family protein [Halalkalicoccus paucihalophilus]KYH25151.1 short chain fatty acid transporter [Halalkalicoccus paucihalophilus]